MLKLSLIGLGLVAITIAIHSAGATSWVRFITSRFVPDNGILSGKRALGALTATGIVLLSLHVLEIFVWATAYLLLLPASEIGTMEAALYFSFVTFTTLGYGDIILSEEWRLLSGIEALNGIMLVGWTIAMMFVVVQRLWHELGRDQE